jgi:hypothetical protein
VAPNHGIGLGGRHSRAQTAQCCSESAECRIDSLERVNLFLRLCDDLVQATHLRLEGCVGRIFLLLQDLELLLGDAHLIVSDGAQFRHIVGRGVKVAKIVRVGAELAARVFGYDRQGVLNRVGVGQRATCLGQGNGRLNLRLR